MWQFMFQWQENQGMNKREEKVQRKMQVWSLLECGTGRPQLPDRHISGLILQVASTAPMELPCHERITVRGGLTMFVGSSFVSSAGWTLAAAAAGIFSACK